MTNRIGYLREVRVEGRLGRIYPVDEVKSCGYKVEGKVKEYKREGS